MAEAELADMPSYSEVSTRRRQSDDEESKAISTEIIVAIV
jgi:hypothetical protein